MKFQKVPRHTEIAPTKAGLRILTKRNQQRKAYFDGLARHSGLIRVRFDGNQQAEVYSEDFWKVLTPPTSETEKE